MRSGPAGQSQGIFLLNPCNYEGMSTKHCHTGSKHYPTAAQSSLASQVVKSKNSNTPNTKILSVLGKAWEKPWAGLSPLLNGLVREAGDLQPQGGSWGQSVGYTHYQLPKKDTHSSQSSLDKPKTLILFSSQMYAPLVHTLAENTTAAGHSLSAAKTALHKADFQN